MPEKLSDQVDKESLWNQPRLEWQLWERIAGLFNRGYVIYGDYCVIYPEFFAPQKNRFINAKLRVADRDHYRLYRGRELYTDDGDPYQYRRLAWEAIGLEGLKQVSSKAIDDLRELASGRNGRKGSPGSIVPIEICLHLDLTAQDVQRRLAALEHARANATTAITAEAGEVD
jgi:hypothetical protein